MRLFEITGDKKFDDMMSKMTRTDVEQPRQRDASTDFPYTVLHPVDGDGAVHITDIPNIRDFENYWDELPDTIQAEFGYDSPVILNGDGMQPIEFDNGLLKREGLKNFYKMTFDQYVALVRKSSGGTR